MRKYLKRKVVHRGYRFTLFQDRVRVNGAPRVREWVNQPKVSAMIVLPKKNQMILVRQYRYGVDQYLWEIPAGTVDGNERPLTCAKRECEEETGYKPLNMKNLGNFVTAPAESCARVYLYFTNRLVKTQTNFDEDENIQIKTFSISQVKRMLKTGIIQDAKSIIALHRFFGMN